MASVTVKRTGTAETGKVYIGTNHTPVQQAIDYVAGTGGGTVFIEAGSYTFTSPVTLAANVEVCGEGDHTLLYTANGGGFVGNGLTGVYIHDLRLDGSKASGASAHGISLTAMGAGPDNGTGFDAGKIGTTPVTKGFTIEDVTFFDLDTYGLYSLNCFTGAIRRCRFDAVGEQAMLLDGLKASDVAENLATNCHYGFYANNPEEVQFTDNTVDHCWGTTFAAFHVLNGLRCDFSGNTARNNRGEGARFIQMEGCTYSANQTVNNAGNGVHHSGASEGNVYAANVFVANQLDQLLVSGTGNKRSVLASNILAHGGAYGLNVSNAPNMSLVGNVAAYDYDYDIRNTGANAWIGGNTYQGLTDTGTGSVTSTNKSI